MLIKPTLQGSHTNPFCIMRRQIQSILRLAVISALAFVWFLAGSNALAKDLPGATQTSYAVTQNGTFSFNIPIVIPAGTNNIHPNFSISYSSERRQGAMGVGWGLSGLSSIARCGKTHAIDGIKGGVLHNGNDRFCLNGKRLIVVSGNYGADGSVYRTEIDEFSRITAVGTGSVNVNGGRAPTWWKVERKDGLIMEYANVVNGRFKLPGTSSIHEWKLSRVRDRNGNYYQVNYRTGDGLPDKVNYTTNTGLVADKEVKFIYENRTDTRSRYIAGKKISFNQRIKEIQVKKGSTLVRKYKLTYEYGPASKNSRITKVTECGLNNACFTPINIAWMGEQSGFRNATANSGEEPKESMIEYYAYAHNLEGTSQTSSRRKEINRGAWVDVNGDGEVDQVIAYRKPDGGTVFKTYLKLDNGSWSPNQSQWNLPLPLRSYSNAVTNMSTGRFKSPVINMGQFVDVNGDGLVDVVYAYRYDQEVHQTGLQIVQKLKTYLNNGNGWTESAAYKPKDFMYDYAAQVYGVTGKETTKGRFVDLNGDGLVDWITAFHYRQAAWSSTPKAWLNTGSGWALSSAYTPPAALIEYYGNHTWGRGELVDVNGDGLPDWVEAYDNKASWDGTVRNTWVNTGQGWNKDNSYNLTESIYHYDAYSKAEKRGSFIDVNGDGLRDWVRSYRTNLGSNSSRKTLLNTGKTWQESTGYLPQFTHTDYRLSEKTGSSGNDPLGAQWPVVTTGVYADVNRDGLVDFVQSYKDSDTHFPEYKNTWINTGSGWNKQNSYNINRLMFDYSGRHLAKPRRGDIADIDTTASVDWIESREDLSNVSRINKLVKTDLVSQVTTTMGVVVKPMFKLLTDNDTLYTRVVGSPETDAYFMEAPICVVAELRVSRPDHDTTYNSTFYQYAGAQVHRKGRGYLGFKQRWVIDNTKGLSSFTEYDQTFPYVGLAKITSVSKGAQILSETAYTYSSTGTAPLPPPWGSGGPTRYSPPRLTQSISEKRELNGGDVYQSVYKEFAYDALNNLTREYTRIGNETGNTQQEVEAINTYDNLTSSWLIGLKKSDTTTYKAPGRANRVRRNAYTYDGRGRLKTSTREPSAAAHIKQVMTYGYDTYGNITTETTTASGQSRTNTITYDSKHRLPRTYKNALNQTSLIDYHPHCDLQDEVTDPNGLKVTYAYDNFCRQTKETAPGNISTTTSYKNNPSCSASDCQTTAKFSVTTRGAGEAPVTEYYNKHGQTLLTTTLGLQSNLIRQKTNYDRYGRVVSQSQPYFAADSKNYTSYTYDILDRRKVTTLPYGGDVGTSNSNGKAYTTQSYAVYGTGANKRHRVISRNTRGKNKTSYTNALGQITQIKDANNQSMTYNYDAAGNLRFTNDAANNEIEVQYDVISRRKKLIDPDMGTTIYTYNGFDEQLTQKDAKNQTISTTYDILGRIETRTVPGTESAGTSTYIYDNAVGKGKGAIAKVVGPNGYEKTYKYDNLGRLNGDTTKIKGRSYTQSYTYNADGFLNSRSYPASGSGNPFKVKYHYLNGYLTTITDDDDCIEYWRTTDYDASGRARREILGDIVEVNRGYQTAKGVLSTIETINAQGQTVQDLSYTYDAMANVTSRVDHRSSVNETFLYDNLDRLTRHTRTGQTTVNVTYNAIGNILTKSDVGTYSYGAGNAGPHAVTRVNNASIPSFNQFAVNWEFEGQTIPQGQPQIHNTNYIYDNSGNIKVSGNRYIWWTAFDKPYRIERINADGNVAAGSSIEYDADFNRIFKSEDRGDDTVNLPSLGLANITETTAYVGKDYEYITKYNQNGSVDSIKHRYTIAAGWGSVQVERADGTSINDTKYLLIDNLGSTNVILDDQGNIEQTLAYDPWGMRLNVGNTTAVNGVTNKGFTGHEMDDEVGLVNMNARIYDPYLGRFLSADPVLPYPNDMQSFNRYSYTRNNPLRYTDPSGNCDTEDADDCYEGEEIEEVVVTGEEPDYEDLDDDDFLGGGGDGDGNGGDGGDGDGQSSHDEPDDSKPVTESSKPTEPTKPVTNTTKPNPTIEEIVVTVPVISRPQPVYLDVNINPYDQSDAFRESIIESTLFAKVPGGRKFLSKLKGLFGKKYPTKLNKAGKPQPYDPKTGRYLSNNANPGFKNSPAGRYGLGFAQGFSEGYSGAVGATPVGVAGARGHSAGMFVGQAVSNFGSFIGL